MNIAPHTVPNRPNLCPPLTQLVEETIPYVGSLLCGDLKEVVETGEVLPIATKAVSNDKLNAHLRPGMIIINLVHLEKSQHIQGHASYEGICWQ
jgi:hypothetical protein